VSEPGPGEQETLAGWSGWGAVPQIFDGRQEWTTDNAQWRAPHQHIERPPDGGALWRVAQAMLTVGGAQSEIFGTLVLVQQMMRLAQTISDTHEAAGRLGQARWAAEAAQRAGLAAHRMQTGAAPPTRERAAEPQRALPEPGAAAGQRTNRSRQRPSDTGAVREDREWER